MKVGVLDLLTTPARSRIEALHHGLFTRQYPGVTPQAISVWCRRAGHRTDYATYFGVGDPRRLLPDDLDVVFVASYTQASPLAYALAKLWRRAGVRTVLGGPHAKAFPADALRFFDVVVGECDAALIADVVAGRIDSGTYVSAVEPYHEVPSVEERMPELTASVFRGGRPYLTTTIPLLASTGCPYACDFCVDWERPYRQLSLDRLACDLRFIADRLPGVLYGFHDPNFAVRFDEVLDVMDVVPRARRNPYIIETSLSVLRGTRMGRLADTNCIFLAPGVESWNDYSHKAGAGAETGARKLARLVDHFTALHEHVPYLQANFLFGVDGDADDEPVALTKEFMTRLPFVWPVVNVPHPFGGTPLFTRWLADERILRAMPFGFWYAPFVAARFAHYGPVEYYRRLVDLYAHFTSPSMLLRRLRATRHARVRAAHVLRTAVKRQRLGLLRRLLGMLEEDRAFRAFHEGESDTLPAFYREEYRRLLGPFAEVLSPADRRPVLDQPEPARYGVYLQPASG